MTATYVILVVEDEELHRKMLVKVLQTLGHEVLVATDGEAGIKLAELKRPHLILMDINMPVMDGLTATRLIKKNPATASIPIIALSALAMSGDQEKALAAGCDDYISKPALIKPLGDKLKEWLGKSRHSAADIEGGTSHDNR